ncbi:MAG: outer membrane protein assembly factor [Candidatus Moduliflexus flocculans]|nr:outer membrane protein assembly factor [Candidatus Moduliflexus flocculans]
MTARWEHRDLFGGLRRIVWANRFGWAFNFGDFDNLSLGPFGGTSVTFRQPHEDDLRLSVRRLAEVRGRAGVAGVLDPRGRGPRAAPSAPSATASGRSACTTACAGSTSGTSPIPTPSPMCRTCCTCSTPPPRSTCATTRSRPARGTTSRCWCAWASTHGRGLRRRRRAGFLPLRADQAGPARLLQAARAADAGAAGGVRPGPPVRRRVAGAAGRAVVLGRREQHPRLPVPEHRHLVLLSRRRPGLCGAGPRGRGRAARGRQHAVGVLRRAAGQVWGELSVAAFFDAGNVVDGAIAAPSAGVDRAVPPQRRRRPAVPDRRPGPIRLDIAVPLQDDPRLADVGPVAFRLTIGEAFTDAHPAAGEGRRTRRGARDPTSTSRAGRWRRRILRWALRVLVVLGVLVVLAGGLLWFLLATETGSRWVDRARGPGDRRGDPGLDRVRLPRRHVVLDTVRLANVVIRDPAGCEVIRVAEADVAIDLLRLLDGEGALRARARARDRTSLRNKRKTYVGLARAFVDPSEEQDPLERARPGTWLFDLPNVQLADVHVRMDLQAARLGVRFATLDAIVLAGRGSYRAATRVVGTVDVARIGGVARGDRVAFEGGLVSRTGRWVEAGAGAAPRTATGSAPA